MVLYASVSASIKQNIYLANPKGVESFIFSFLIRCTVSLGQAVILAVRSRKPEENVGRYSMIFVICNMLGAV